MSSSSKKRQTMAKMTRERLVKEKRALKAEKREAKKQAAADARQAEATGIPIAPETVDDAALPDA
jgi:stress response protein YsnF